MAKARNSFILYYDFEEQTASLTDAQVGQLIRAILDYERRGVFPETEDSAIQMAFRFLKVGLDLNAEKYEKICQRNRNNRMIGYTSAPVVTSGTYGTDTEPNPNPEPETEPEF